MNINDFIESFKDYLEINDEKIEPTTEFRKLNGWGSMSVLSVIALADTEFSKEIEAEDLKVLRTIEDLYGFLISK